MNKRYNVKGLNGVYLGYQSTDTPTLNNYVNELIRDYDFFPMDNQMANTFSFKNASYSNPNKIIGSNTLSNVNSISSRVLVRITSVIFSTIKCIRGRPNTLNSSPTNL